MIVNKLNKWKPVDTSKDKNDLEKILLNKNDFF